MKIIKNFIIECICWGSIMAMAIVPCWVLYKILAGAYHLLDKLIDKL